MTFPSSTAKNRTRLVGMLLAGGVCMAGVFLFAAPTGAGSATNTQPGKQRGTAAAGRSIFNGKGMCSSCHGVDGYRDQLPEDLTPKVRENITRLDPSPPDLRNATGLILTTDKQRFESIRHGHLRSAMQPLPKQVLTDEDIISLLAYLASIRGTVSSAPALTEANTSLRGDAKIGRQLYHEVGGCAVCHGMEGHLNQRPPISADLAQKLDRLPVPPANLRDAATLKSQNDQDRFQSIKLGHPGTAMFPKHLLRDDDIRDLVAYLAVLRGERH